MLPYCFSASVPTAVLPVSVMLRHTISCNFIIPYHRKVKICASTIRVRIADSVRHLYA
jgi:hypothetical protein